VKYHWKKNTLASASILEKYLIFTWFVFKHIKNITYTYKQH